MTTTAGEAPTDAGAPWPLSICIADVIDMLTITAAEREQIRRQAYRDGVADGRELGHREAEAEMDAWWARLARRIRADADRVRGRVPEPKQRPEGDDSIWFQQVEWVRLTGRSGA